MPLHGKIVVIKRNGGDGTEFPLTTACLFGRKAECDIRIQLPGVSKEHCRIELNENKEVILTNLSATNPTHINGKILQQSERLKHGDLITVLDRSFRFEYPPAPTPKKRTAAGATSDTLKVLRDQQVSEAVVADTGEKKSSEVSTDPHLKDGANIDNIQRSLEKTLEVESKEDESQSKTSSPFGDLYEMIKKSLHVKTPRVSSMSLVQTPTSRLCTPKSASVLKNHDKSITFTPKKDEMKVPAVPRSAKKQEKTIPVPSADMTEPRVEEGQCASKSEATPKPQKFTVSEVLEQISAHSSKSPTRRRSKEGTPVKSAASMEQGSPKTENPRRTSPRTLGTAEKVEKVSKKRKSGELGSDLPASKMKKKRVSFGGHLSPELFDKRLPPDSPLRRGATPRRSLSHCKPKLSVLRRASVIGFLKEKSPAKTKTPSPKRLSGASPKTPAGKKSPKSTSPSPKPASASKKSPQSKSSPKATSPGKRTPKPASPAQKSPKSRSSTPKATSPAQTSPRSSPVGNSPKSKRSSPAPKSSTEKVGTPKANDQLTSQRKSTTPGREACNATPTGKRSSPRESSQKASSVGATPSQNVQTPVTQGRFSVSQISTPSPAAEVDAVVQREPVISVTPRIHLKRISMKSTSRKTPIVSRSAKKILKRSGISRASLKAVQTSWANIVKFGQTKTQTVALANKTVTQKTIKMAVSKPQEKIQTPAKKLEGHVSTGHADSPVTIVVGRAHKRTVLHPAGAAPRVVTNTALSKKDMNMDEDLTGISEMFKTPANERKRRSLMNESSATKTPATTRRTSGIEPSVLNTPEEPGEMVVSPLSVASTVKSQRYNSEAVQRLLDGDQDSSFVCDIPTVQVQLDATEQQDFKSTSITTPRQKPELPESLTGVKRIMKTPKQTAEPIEDLRGKILKTPRQKAEQQECLTGVKRIMKTPKQKSEPLEDIRGKLLITPKQKPEQQECLTGVKRIFKTPKQKAEPVEDLRGKLLKTPKARRSGEVSLDGVKELLETPAQKSDHQSEMTVGETPTIKSSMVCITDIKRTPKHKNSPVEDTVGQKRIVRTPKQKGKPVEENFGIKRLMKSPRLRGVAPVEDFEGLQELMQEPLTYWAETKTNEVIMETEAQNASQQQPEEETETDQAIQKKTVRGRRAKTVESKDPEDRNEASDPPEDLVIVAPVRGRRGKKTVAAAPPSVKHMARSRNTATTEITDPTVTEDATQPTEGTCKTKRGRNARKNPKDPSEEEITPDCDVTQKVNDCAAPADKPKRGRKPDQSAAQQQTEDVPPSGVKEACSEQPEVLPDVLETAIQAAENPPEADAAACEVTEISSTQKKSVRGRRAKQTGSKEAEGCSGEPVSAPVRGRRAKKTEPAASSAVRLTTRTRNIKCQESASDQQIVETQAVNEVSAEAINAVNPTLEKKESTLLPEEVTSKPVRGRKAKAAPAEPEEAQAQPPLSVPSAVEKPKRGRRTKSDAEDKHVTVEIKQQPEPPVRVKRGRNGQQKEEGQDVDDKTTSQETSVCLEPVKKSRRTKKAEQDHEKPDVQSADVLPEKTETPSVEPMSVSEQAVVATKLRRGGRKAKPDPETAAAVQSSDVPDASKPKGRRGKQVTQDIVTTDEPKEQNKPALSPQMIKASRTRGRKSEMSPVVPAKKARRGTTAPVQEASEESAVHVSEPAPAPIKPAQRGRRAAAKNEITSNAAISTEDLTEAAAKESKKSKKSVQFTSDVQVLEIPKATPAKARRGGKSKLGNVKGESGSKDADKPEEESLSEETVKAQPVRRGRRGGKAADVIVESTSQEGVEDAETEPQPKTRRGRSAKK